MTEYKMQELDSFDLYNYYLFHLWNPGIKTALKVLKDRWEIELIYSLAINLANCF